MELKPTVLFEDSYIIAVNKPYGLVVNNSRSWKGITLQDLVYGYINSSIDSFQTYLDSIKNLETIEKAPIDESSLFTQRWGLVHRLDKETSGVILIAKNEDMLVNLLNQFKFRQVKKMYIALVYGKFPKDYIEVNAPIKRHPLHRTKFAVVVDGKPSQTFFKLKQHYRWGTQIISLITAEPKTGRTHQIRVHLTALLHPVLGDNLYLGKNRVQNSREVFGRLMLHASHIVFTHPATNTSISIDAPLPQEFLEISNIEGISALNE
ncbi:MAG: RluA family pseudouridine synthase [Patescibacteria group bacterium]|uniref:Pseudouridine synthase n=1 Tax=candidate division WWE3 bacterium TaxID=2053526 RepID=A0A955EAS0_UNCKA|nr:RluA family pseudouridine synthase [candidate division WWE3 bacterium]